MALLVQVQPFPPDYSEIAQWVEREAHNFEDLGSMPGFTTNFLPNAPSVGGVPVKHLHPGSSPGLAAR